MRIFYRAKKKESNTGCLKPFAFIENQKKKKKKLILLLPITQNRIVDPLITNVRGNLVLILTNMKFFK